VLTPPVRPVFRVDHKPAGTFKRGKSVVIQVTPKGKVDLVELRYRRVNQADAWQSARMIGESGSWTKEVPAAYTDSPFPLQYYFVIHRGKDVPALHPGLGASLMDQPYFVARQA
jgi:hypothetical protein